MEQKKNLKTHKNNTDKRLVKGVKDPSKVNSEHRVGRPIFRHAGQGPGSVERTDPTFAQNAPFWIPGQRPISFSFFFSYSLSSSLLSLILL